VKKNGRKLAQGSFTYNLIIDEEDDDFGMRPSIGFSVTF